MGFLAALFACGLIKTGEFLEQNSPSKKQEIARAKKEIEEMHKRICDNYNERMKLGE